MISKKHIQALLVKNKSLQPIFFFIKFSSVMSTSSKVIYILVIVPLFLAVSCAVLKRNEFRPVEKGENWRVRLTKFESGSDVVTKGGFDHPYNFSLLKLNRILGAIYYEDANVLGKARKYQVFTSRVRVQLLKPIQKAFSVAKPDEVVDFSFMLKEQVMVFFANDFFTSGIMFVKDGKLNIVFRTINYKGVNYSEAVRQFVGDPTNRPIANPWKLIPGPGQTLKKAPKSSFSFFDMPYYTNWLIIDLDYDFRPAPLKKRRRHKRRIERLSPQGEAPRIRFENPKPNRSTNGSNIYYQKSGHGPIDDPETRRKLQILRELYNSGQISRSTYERKKDELLSPR